MRRGFDLNYLNEDESAQILNVLEKDFQLRMKEKTRLSKIKKRIHEQDRSARLLAGQKEFNTACCIRCFRRFVLLLNPRFRCFACGFDVCTKCCKFFIQFRDFVCVTCQMEKDVMAQSCDWFYETVQRKFRQTGSAKVVRRLSASYRSRGQDLPVTGKMRASVLSVFSGDQEAIRGESLSTPESSENEDVMDKDEDVAPNCRISAPENSQREVLRRMKSLQISRFHHRMREAMDKICVALRETYPRGLPSSAHRVQFRKFIHKSKDELTVILKNFSQILAITIESHNLALGKNSENVQVDIQCILQDEVEGIVSRRIDVNFDDCSSLITDEGSRSGLPTNSVESKLALVILRKILDDHRAAFGGPRISFEEEEMLREFDSIVDNESTHSSQKRYSDMVRRSAGDSESFLREVDPDILSLSNVTDPAFVRSTSSRPRSDTSHKSHGSGSHWLPTGRPTASGESVYSFERGHVRMGDCDAEGLSELSSGEQEVAAVNFDCAAFSDISGSDTTPWVGTSSETEKKFLLQQLQHHQDEEDIADSARVMRVSKGLLSANRSVTGAALDLEDSARQHKRDSTDKARVKRVSQGLLAANQSVTGTALELENSSRQMQTLIQQLTSLEKQVDSIQTKYLPTTALRKSSDHSVRSAARVLASLPVARSADPDRAQVEEDVDKIEARIGTTITLETSPKSEPTSNVEQRVAQTSASNSDVAFGYRPPSRNAWDEYKMS